MAKDKGKHTTEAKEEPIEPVTEETKAKEEPIAPATEEAKAEEAVETKPETMELVAYQDDGGVIKKVKTALGDTYTLDELLAIIRSKAVRCIMQYDGREVDVSLSGSGISAMEGTTDLLPKLATF